MPRAHPMAPEERRQALVDATGPLLLEHGRAVTTRQIAEAAGVAEGTIFRVFESKDDLVEAAVRHALDPGPFVDALSRIEPHGDLRERVLLLTRLMQQRFTAIFRLMAAVGMTGPPKRAGDEAQQAQWGDWQSQVGDLLARHLTAAGEELNVDPGLAVRALRALTFAGSNPNMAVGRAMSAEEITDLFLYGIVGTGREEA